MLSSNTDVFAYMYVLDYLVDICTPYLGMDALGGVWAIGFFGRQGTEVAKCVAKLQGPGA